MAKRFPKALPDFYLTRTHVKLLKHAVVCLREGEKDYVCSAIEHGANNPEYSGIKCKEKTASRASNDLRKFIGRAIKGECYFDDWQDVKGIVTSDSCKDRIDWVKYILKNADRVDR
jgi:acyl-CoA-binding protein